MAHQVRIEGDWPASLTFSRGWARAVARPWNDPNGSALLRMERGGLDFLQTVTGRLVEMTGAAVYSPAMYSSSTAVWRRAGYEEMTDLRVMERAVGDSDGPRHEVVLESTPDWQRLHEIDEAAFQGFWRMSIQGLIEASAATRQSVVLTTGPNGSPSGYAIVGAQWNIGYLQRIAVHPVATGRGHGSDLVRAALRWAGQAGARMMVLNVRDSNLPARRLYIREGFAPTPTSLWVLRYSD